MTNSLLLFDGVLGLTLVVIALRVLLARDLFQSVVLFIIFGLLLGIAWCRLEAVDVALAEVALGAGVTGALLVNTLSATRRQEANPNANPPILAAAAFVALFASGLAAVVVPLARTAHPPRIAVGEALSSSGVTNPVTAVLLNFRAYDTLLEVAVLLAAVFAVLPLLTTARETRTHPVGPVLGAFVRLLVPLMTLVAIYVLWAGTKAPGGAFQAAAILGAGGILMLVCGAQAPSCDQRRWRVVLVAGVVVFLLVGGAGLVTGGHFLELSPAWAGASILLIETALTASIALILIVLFHGISSGPDENGPDVAANDPNDSDNARAIHGHVVQETSP